MKITNDQKGLFMSWVSTILDSYKIVVACLLSVFVPQYCSTGTCTLTENFTNLTPFNLFVIIFNFITLSLFVNLYYLQTRRETYFITHLDIDHDKAVNSLETNLLLYPYIFGRVKDHNNKLFFHTKLTTVTFYINVLFSSILVCYYFYDGIRTVTTLITNVLLATSKLYSLWDMLDNKEHTLALSGVISNPISYNVIDPQYVNNIELETVK